MAQYKCKGCGNDARFRIQLYGRVMVDTAPKHGRQAAGNIDLSATEVVEVQCLSCVASDTRIATNPNGTTRIGSMRQDWLNTKILSVNPRTNKIKTASCGGYIEKERQQTELIKTLLGHEIRVTPDHLFMTPAGWLPANRLRAGSLVAVCPNTSRCIDGATAGKGGQGKTILSEAAMLRFIKKIEGMQGKKKAYETENFKELNSIDAERIRCKIKEMVSKGYSRPHIKKHLQHYYNLKIDRNSPLRMAKLVDRGAQHGASYVIEVLKTRKLLPLTTGNNNLPIVSRLMGHLFGDGYLSSCFQGNAKRQDIVTIGFTGNREDLCEIKKDLDSIGFAHGSIVTAHAKSRLSDGHIINGITTKFTCSSRALWLLFAALGTPIGDKACAQYRVPKWLWATPRAVKREFLASFTGSEARKIRVSKKNVLRGGGGTISQSKAARFVSAGCLFMRDIQKILRHFGVEAGNPQVIKGLDRKDGTHMKEINLTIRPSEQNLSRFVESVGYRYAIKSQEEAERARCYFLYKQALRKIGIHKGAYHHKTFRNALDRVLSMIEKGEDTKYTCAALAARLSMDTETTRKHLKYLVRSGVLTPAAGLRKRKGACKPEILYKLNTQGLVFYKGHLAHEVRQYQMWAKKYLKGDVLWVPVTETKPSGVSDVRDLAVAKYHNYIANGFVVHNCGALRSRGEVTER